MASPRPGSKVIFAMTMAQLAALRNPGCTPRGRRDPRRELARRGLLDKAERGWRDVYTVSERGQRVLLALEHIDTGSYWK